MITYTFPFNINQNILKMQTINNQSITHKGGGKNSTHKNYISLSRDESAAIKGLLMFLIILGHNAVFTNLIKYIVFCNKFFIFFIMWLQLTFG